MQANSHWSQGEHCIDIRLSKNTMQILSAFTLFKDLFQDFFLHPYNFHHLGVGGDQVSVTDSGRERNQAFCKVVVEAFILKKASWTGFVLCMMFMETYTLTVFCQQNKVHRRTTFSELTQKNIKFVTAIWRQTQTKNNDFSKDSQKLFISKFWQLKIYFPIPILLISC